jgi:hypothetical protein
VKRALADTEYTVQGYKDAVQAYRNTRSKREKAGLERVIADIKARFRQEAELSDPLARRKQRLEAELSALTKQGALFEPTRKEAQETEARVTELSARIAETEAGIAELRSGKIYENAFEWRFEFPEALSDEGDFIGFDIVIGNPPYISTRNNFDVTVKEYYKSNYKLAVGQFDLYVLFIEKANTLLSHNGVLSFITPKKLLTNENFEGARRFFLKSFPIKNYLDAQMPFESAAVEANVFVATRKSTDSINTYCFNGDSIIHKFKVYSELIALMPFNIFPFTMDPDNIVVIDSIARNTQHTLDEYLTITRGFEFGFNHPSVSHEKGKYKIIKGEHIGKYVIKETDWYVKPDFSNKKVFKTKEVFLSTPKLVSKFVSNTLDFAMDEKGYCNTNVVYNANPTIGNEGYLKFLLALCNSKLINFWFFNTYANDDNLFPHIQKNQLESIPVIIPDNVDNYDTVVDKILAAKAADPKADTGALETQIDEAVYRLYGLTEEERKVVEGE